MSKHEIENELRKKVKILLKYYKKITNKNNPFAYGSIRPTEMHQVFMAQLYIYNNLHLIDMDPKLRNQIMDLAVKMNELS